MFDTAMAPEFAEGTIELTAETWFCMDHSLTLKVGFDCPFCASEQMSEAEFSKWLVEQSR